MSCLSQCKSRSLAVLAALAAGSCGAADSADDPVSPWLVGSALDPGDASAGSAGTSGAAGEGGSAGSSEGGSAGAAGASGEAGSMAGGAAGTPGGCAGTGVNVSCGDGVRDPQTEECDDGLGASGALRACTGTCAVVDHLATNESCGIERFLGSGRHPVAAAWHGNAVAFMDLENSEPPRLAVVTSSPAGEYRGMARISGMLLDAGPVVAPLSDGSFAVAFSSLGADGDGLGIGLVKVSGDAASVGAVQQANTTYVLGQHSPEIMAVGDTVVVGWEDDSPLSARTVCYRAFSSDLVPFGPEQCEAPSDFWRSHLVLAEFNGSLARAWREEDGESGSVRVSTGIWQSSFPLCCDLLPDGGWPGGGIPDTSEAPALVALSATALLLVHAYGNGQLFAVVVDEQASTVHGPVYLNDTDAPRTHPALAATADGIYLAWRGRGEGGGSAHDDLFLQKLGWDGQTLDTATHPVLSLPRQATHWPGDQTGPALAGACDGLLAAWNDLTSANFAGECEHGDVGVELIPTPIYRSGAM